MFFVIIEFIACLIAREWINLFLQFGLMILMFVVLCCMRNSEKARLVMYQAYAFVFLLNLIELVAMSIVYFEVFDYIKELCE